MDQFGHNAGLQGALSELTMDATMIPPSVGISSSKVPANSTHRAIWGTKTALTHSLEPIHEGEGRSPASTHIC